MLSSKKLCLDQNSFQDHVQNKGGKMYIEDLIKEYPDEMDALCIDQDSRYSWCELQELADRCQYYRERKELLKRIEVLEDRFSKLESIIANNGLKQ